MSSNRRRKVAGILAACVAPAAAVALVPTRSLAVTKTFHAANQAWLTATNWTPSGLPTSADDILVNAGVTEMTLSAGAIDARFIVYTNTQNRGLGNMTGGATNSTLTLHGDGGSSSLISVTSAGTFTIRGPNSGTGTGVLGLVLNASGSFSVGGTGGLSITSVISETGGARSLEKLGSGTLTLSGASTFTGDFSVSNGDVSVNNIANAGVAQALGMSANAVNLGSASTAGRLVYTGAAASTDRGFALGAAGGGISNANDLTLTGVISGGGAFTKSGTGVLLLSGASGAVSGASAININGGILQLDNVAANSNNRIGDTTALNFGGGELEWNVALAVPTTETVGAMNVNAGANTFNTTVNFGVAGDGVMTAASLSRSAGATMSFLITDGGFLNFAAAPVLSNGILGGWATHNRGDWATIDAGRVVAYTGYTTASDTTTWTQTQNITVDGNRSVTQNTTIHSLRFTPFASPATVSIDAGSTLRIDNGLLAPDTGHVIAGPGSLTAGTTAGSELIVTVPYAGESLSVSAPIVNNSGGAVRLIKSGDGILELNAANTYTGSSDVLAGTLRLGASADISTSAVNVSAGGTLDVNNQAKTLASLNGAGNVQLGAGTLTFGSNGANTTVSGVISGVGGAITKTGTGTTTLTGVNTFTGATNVGDPNGVDAGGVLAIDDDARFGAVPGAATPNSINLANATLRLSGATGVTTVTTSVPIGTRGVRIAANRGVSLNAGNGKIDVPTNEYAEIGGIIADGTGGTSPLHKIGGGILDLRAGTHTYTGGVIIDEGTLAITRDANLGAIPPSLDVDAVLIRNGATLRWYSNTGTTGLNANRGLTIGAGGGTVDWSHSSGVPNVSHPITSAAGNTLTKFGDDTVLSNIAQADMNGDLHINQGRWNTQVSGAAGNGTIALNAPDLPNTPAGTGVAQLGIGGTNVGAIVTLANNIVLNPTGQGQVSFEVNNSTPTQNQLILNGIISGTGGLTKGRVAATTGTLVLGGSNTYTGGTNLLLGTIEVSSNANLGDAAGGIAFGGGASAPTLRVTGNVSGAARAVTVSAPGGTIDTNSFDVTFGDASGAATLTKNSTGTLTLNHVRTTGLTVNAGTVKIAPTGTGTAAGASRLTTLTLGAAARVDLTDNKLITTSALGTWNGTNYTDISGLVDSGRGNAGNAQWDGVTGIVTSDTRAINNGDLLSIGTARVSEVRTVADTETTTFAGQTVLGSDTLAMVTWGGDANLDGKINIDDYGRIDGNVGQSGSVFGWSKGDFNYDGKINIDDYGIIDGNINRQGAAFSTAGSLEGVAAVPEPLGLSLIILLPLSCRRRRPRGLETR